jgi:CBS-domain-containing membrane protein
MNASDVMTAGVITIGPDADVKTAARTMLEKGISALPVIDKNGKLIGIISEGDLIRRTEAGTEAKASWWLRLLSDNETLASRFVKAHGMRVADVMSRDVITATPDTPLAEIARLLEKNRIKRVPIMKDGKPVGVVSRANLLQALASAKSALDGAVKVSDNTLRDNIFDRLRDQPWAHPGMINVIVTGGVVDLWGTVTSEAERKALNILVTETPGVVAVNDHLSRQQIQPSV